MGHPKSGGNPRLVYTRPSKSVGKFNGGQSELLDETLLDDEALLEDEPEELLLDEVLLEDEALLEEEAEELLLDEDASMFIMNEFP